MNLSPILQQLNPKQQEAAAYTEGPLLVFAGAGSGKTRALTHRIAYLIKEKGVSPWNILAVTFTNKAAGEMKERIMNLLGIRATKLALVGQSPDLPTIGTFHSVCVRILRAEIHLIDYENQFNIYDTTDQRILMRKVMEAAGVDEKSLNPKAVLAHISNAKNELVTPGEFEAKATSYFMAKVASLYGPYQKALKKANALDFDDILMKTIELFMNHPAVLQKYQEKFMYIHVDEYQDTNHAQYIFTKLLAQKHNNICVIGDDAQSIYSWRGANMHNILNFEKDYPKAKIILMEQNYRSTQPILDGAHCIISKNKSQKDKKLWTERKEGDSLEIITAENGRAEGEIILKKIADAVKKHETPDYRDFAILYRTNAQSRILEEAFLHHGIPYKIVGNVRFYERKEIKDIIAYLRLIQNKTDVVSLLRIINIPARNIGAKTLEILQDFANREQCSLFEAIKRNEEIGELGDAKKESLNRFARLISRLSDRNHDLPAASLIKYVIEETKYKKMLDDGSVEGEARLENIGELVNVAAKYDKLEAGISLNIFLEEISLVADLDELDSKDNAVTLMTLHQAKGLEYPWVFICGMEEGLLPHTRSLMDPQQLEEERRLLYVGMTRAMDRLFLLHAKRRMLYGDYQEALPSQFLDDIPEELCVRAEKENVEGGGASSIAAGGKANYSWLMPKKKDADIGRAPVPVEYVEDTDF